MTQLTRFQKITVVSIVFVAAAAVTALLIAVVVFIRDGADAAQANPTPMPTGVPTNTEYYGPSEPTNAPTRIVVPPTDTPTVVPTASPSANVSWEYEYENESIQPTPVPTLEPTPNEGPFAGVPKGARQSVVLHGCPLHSVNYSILRKRENRDFSVLRCRGGKQGVLATSKRYRFHFDYRRMCVERCINMGPQCKSIQRLMVSDSPREYVCQFLSCNPFTAGSRYASNRNRRNKFSWLDSRCYD